MSHTVEAHHTRPGQGLSSGTRSAPDPRRRPTDPFPTDVSTWLWGAGAVVLAIATGIIPVLFDHGYYWRGDTQLAYFGALYHLGEELREGRLPLLDPASWQAGAFTVDASWGLWNPLTWAQALAATEFSDALLLMTVVKISVCAISATGVFLLARSYRVADPLACVVAVLVPACGFTMYVDQPSWYHGSLVSALLPWAWWGARRTVLWGRNPFPALLAGYLLATVGYIFGTVMLAVVVVAVILDGLNARGMRGAVKALVVGLCWGSAALAVHLPFIFSSSATIRSRWVIRNDGTGVANISELVTSSIPNVGPDQAVFYVAWLLPMLVFVDWRRARAGSGDLAGIAVVAAVAWLWFLGPSQVGQLRWPIRLMPYVVLASLVLAAIALTRGRMAWSGRRFVGAVAITAVSGYMTMANDPPYWRMQLVSTLAVAAGLTATWLLLRGVAKIGPRPATAAAFAALWTVAIVGLQHHYEPRSNAGDRGMPAQIADYRDPLPAAVGNTFMVGTPRDYVKRNSDLEHFIPFGNMWYLRGLDSQNHASSTRYGAYNVRYCMAFTGNTCPEALQTLLDREPTTGQSRADLMSVSTIVLVKRQVPPRVRKDPPPGWHVAATDELTVTWVRDRPLPAAGGVTWEEQGLDVITLSQEPESVRLRAENVPSGGGTFVMSRLDWPGYEISNAEHASPTDGYLLTVQVPQSSEGEVITLSYAPPHWTVLRALLLGGIGFGALWSALAVGAVLARRRSATTPRRR